MQNSTSSIWTYNESYWVKEVAIIPITVILLIVINNIVVLTTMRKVAPLKIKHYLSMCLAVADLLVTIPYSVISSNILKGYVWLTPDLCDVIGVVNLVCLGAVTWIHSLMCIERAVCVLFSVTHRQLETNKKAKHIVCLSVIACYLLLITLCLCLLFSKAMTFSFIPSIPSCSVNMLPKLMVVYGCLYNALPMSIQLVTSVMIVRFMKQRVNRGRRPSLKKAMKTITLILGVFYICSLPTVVYIIWDLIAAESSAPEWLNFAAGCGLFLNSGTSSVIYLRSMPSFKEALMARRKKLTVVVQIVPLENVDAVADASL